MMDDENSSPVDKFFSEQSIADLEYICRWKSPKNENKSNDTTCGLVPTRSHLPNWVLENKDHKFGKPSHKKIPNLNKSNRINAVMTNEYNRLFLTKLIQKNAQEQVELAMKQAAIKNDQSNRTERLRSLTNRQKIQEIEAKEEMNKALAGGGDYHKYYASP